MKKLMLALLLVLGVHQTTTPMFQVARAAIAARMNKQVVSNLMTNVILPTVGSMVAMHYGMKPVTDLIAHPGFQAHNGLADRHWLLKGKDFLYGWLGEIQQAVAIAGLLMSGATTAYSLKKGVSAQEQPQQAVAHSGSVIVPGTHGQQVQITPEMRAEQHRKNRELLAREGYNPLVIRAS